jgi:APA family basic amino acid/polyamine antiporter
MIIGLYVLINAAYFYALTPEKIASLPESVSVAGAVMARVLGAGAASLMAAGLMVSSFGSLHSSLLTMARVPFAMARDGLLPSFFARVSRRFHVPTYSVLFMGICAIFFAMSGTFDMLTDMVVFSWLIFEILAVAAVFVLRKRVTDVSSVFRAWGYPYLPWVYLLATACLTINTLYALPGRSLAGLGLIALGLPVYFYYTRRRPQLQMDDEPEGDRTP